jgi:putative glycosyltransferase (TIGR04372 family)
VILNLSTFKFQKITNILSNVLNKILFNIGYDINFRSISKFEIKVKKFNTLKKLNKIVDYDDQKKYFNKIKELPGPNMFKEWEEIIIEWENCNPKVFQKLENYYSIRQKNLTDLGLSKFGVDFISKDIFTGSFGMPFHFQVYHESKNLNFHRAETISLIDKIFFNNSNKWSITNQTLFNYVKPFFNLIEDKNKIRNLSFLEKYLSVPINLAIPINKKFLMIEIAKNIINTERYQKKISTPFLSLSKKDKIDSKNMLKQIGIDLQKDWFVTLHARESGYAEKKNSKREFFRNGNIEDYNLAIDLIIKSGGKVVRVGDKSMSKIKEKQGLIDYAHSKHKSKKLDILLAANSKFCIATSSGFFSIACLFDVPVILTNTSHNIVYFRLKKKDFFVPSLLKDKNSNKLIKLDKTMFPPYSMVNVGVEKKYNEWNVEYIKNSPEDILHATEEMLERLKKDNFDELQNNQLEVKNKLNNKQQIYTTETIQCHGIFPEKFLKRYPEII